MTAQSTQARQCKRNTTSGERCTQTTLAQSQDCGRHGTHLNPRYHASGAEYQEFIDGEIHNMMAAYAEVADTISFDSDDWIEEIEKAAAEYHNYYERREVERIIESDAFKARDYDIPMKEYSGRAERQEAYWRGKHRFMAIAL